MNAQAEVPLDYVSQYVVMTAWQANVTNKTVKLFIQHRLNIAAATQFCLMTSERRLCYVYCTIYQSRRVRKSTIALHHSELFVRRYFTWVTDRQSEQP